MKMTESCLSYCFSNEYFRKRYEKDCQEFLQNQYNIRFANAYINTYTCTYRF